VVFIGTLGLLTIVNYLLAKQKNTRKLFADLIAITAPVCVALLFFILQKMTHGWFLFPLHTQYISNQWVAFKDNLPSAAAYLFIYYGRNGYIIFVIISLLTIRFFRPAKYSINEKAILPAFGIFIVFYLMFSSVNFYIPRYLLCIFPPLFIAVAVLIDKAFSGIKVIYPLIMIGCWVTSLYYYHNQVAGGDNDYSPSVKAAKAMVRYCEQNRLNDTHIFAPTVLRIDFTMPYAGYLEDSPFTAIQYEFDASTEYCIFTSDEDGKSTLEQLAKDNKFKLVNRSEIGYAWCELYQVIR
jgi:hypothetical protein